MNKHLMGLVLAVALAPLAGHAATATSDCKALQTRILELDRDIVCAEKKGGNARLDYMLERNFLMQLHEASICSSRKVPEAVMKARAKMKCGR
jgi:hypothetical protein